MAAATVQIACMGTTNAQFVAWAQNVSSHIASAGMTPIANNIDWATISTPATANLRKGWEVWSFADALQSSVPVFFRLDYGSGTTNTFPGFWLTLGSGYYGNGQLSGLLSSPLLGSGVLHPATGANQANTENCYFSGNTNYINTWLWMNKDAGVTISIPMGFSIERTKDASGVDTGQGVMMALYGASTFYQTVWDCFAGQLYQWEVQLTSLMPALGTGASGANVAVYPVFHSFGNAFLNPGLNLMTYFNADLANNTAQTISVYGSNHTYITSGSVGIQQGLFRPGSGVGLLIRYE